MKIYLMLIVGLLISTFTLASILDQKKYDLQREILNSLLKLQNDNVDTKACNLKTARVADFLSHLIILASAPDVEGRKKVFSLNCEDRTNSKLKYSDEYNCYLKAGESIRLPNEPEGWARHLQFNFDFKTKQVMPRYFRCLDIP